MNQWAAKLELIIKELPDVQINFPNGVRADQIDSDLYPIYRTHI